MRRKAARGRLQPPATLSTPLVLTIRILLLLKSCENASHSYVACALSVQHLQWETTTECLMRVLRLGGGLLQRPSVSRLCVIRHGDPAGRMLPTQMPSCWTPRPKSLQQTQGQTLLQRLPRNSANHRSASSGRSRRTRQSAPSVQRRAIASLVAQVCRVEAQTLDRFGYQGRGGGIG